MPNEIGFEFTIEGLDELEGRLDLQRTLIRGMRRASAHVEGEVKAVTPVNKDTTPGQHRGRLAASWTHDVKVRGGNIEGIVGTNVVYGPFVNFGTGIFGPSGQRIIPTRKAALAFMFRGRPVVVRSVAGQPGQHFAEKGMKNAEGDAQDIVIETIQDHLDGRP